jgi:chaperone modulatory protein CbpM
MPAKTPSSRDEVLLDETEEVTLADLTRTCRVHAEWVLELVQEGVLEPLGPGGPQWRFAATSVVRIKKAQRLQRDLGVNLPGIALALELLDRIDTLEARLRAAAVPPPPDDAE